jgi:hypothetical protein
MEARVIVGIIMTSIGFFANIFSGAYVWYHKLKFLAICHIIVGLACLIAALYMGQILPLGK